jgi:hypothetical protein
LLTPSLLAEVNTPRDIEKIWKQTSHAINVPVLLLKECLWEYLPILKGKDIVPIPKSKQFLFPNNGSISLDATKELKELFDQRK